MVLSSSKEEPKKVEPLAVLEGSIFRDRVTVDGEKEGQPVG